MKRKARILAIIIATAILITAVFLKPIILILIISMLIVINIGLLVRFISDRGEHHE